MGIKFFKVTELPNQENLQPSSFYYDLKEVEVDEETILMCDLYVTTKGSPVELIPLDTVSLPDFVEALSGKMDKPIGSITQYIRGDGSLGDLSGLAPIRYFQVEYKEDAIPLPSSVSDVPFIIIDVNSMQKDTGAFEINDGELIITEGYASLNQKIMIFWI